MFDNDFSIILYCTLCFLENTLGSSCPDQRNHLFFFQLILFIDNTVDILAFVNHRFLCKDSKFASQFLLWVWIWGVNS